MIEQALRTYLLTKPAIVAFVKNRIHVGDYVPLDTKDLPAINIEADPQERLQQIDGEESSMQFPMFDIVVKAQQFATSIKIGDLIAAAFRTIRNGAVIFTAPGTVIAQINQSTLVGTGTAWTSDQVGQAIQLRDGNGNLVYSGTVTSWTSATMINVTPAPSSSATGLLYDFPSAPLAVQITQVDCLGKWNDDEIEQGHGLTVKPRVVKIRVGWLEDVSTI